MKIDNFFVELPGIQQSIPVPGPVVLYTSLAPTESKPLAEAFEKKYGIKVELWRALSDKVVQRVVTEAQGKRFSVDVVETNGPEMEMLARERLLDAIEWRRRDERAVELSRREKIRRQRSPRPRALKGRILEGKRRRSKLKKLRTSVDD